MNALRKAALNPDYLERKFPFLNAEYLNGVTRRIEVTHIRNTLGGSQNAVKTQTAPNPSELSEYSGKFDILKATPPPPLPP